MSGESSSRGIQGVSSRHCCPSCGTGVVSEPIGTSLRCIRCGWRLVTRAEWQDLAPYYQGYASYAQGSWPTSELSHASNPYEEGSAAWKKFRQGEHRAMLDAQDGEE